jgi:predicted transposase/invertase (TIGR01784 family)
MTYVDTDLVAEVRRNREMLLERHGGIEGLHKYRVNQSDISPELRKEFEMQWAPIDEVQKELAIEAAREEGKLEVAGRMLSDGFSIENVIKYTGLDEEEILSLG